jgi:predicted patatin/cPLA2 family phospholipase
MNVGLVLEGGGMRGVYTAGVLDYLMEQELYYPYVVGVSAGACNATSYISRQIGRNRKVTVDFIGDPRYLSYRNLLKEKSMFGMKFIFDEIPRRLVPFDFDTFFSSPQQFVVGAMDVRTGEAVYYTKETAKDDMMAIVQASSSLPFISRPVVRDGRELMDGGICDPIPVRKSLAEGNERNVIVLTQVKSYRKRPFQWGWLARRVYPKYRGLIEVLSNRHHTYNSTLEFVDELERDGKAIVIRPSVDLNVSRIEKNPAKLAALYELGYRDAERQKNVLKSWA